MCNELIHYSAVGVSSVDAAGSAGASSAGAAVSAAFLGAAVALLLRVFLAGSVAEAIELP
jgi:hypothetical protein